jgi:3-dehydroquinate dehydratase / shikimate dehydrogenase
MKIKTKRLILRPWQEKDLKPFAALNADHRVMEYFPSLLTQKESDDRVHSWQAKIKAKGWGLWAVSISDIADFIGFIGLEYVNFEAHFTPAVEIGWRLAYPFWGKGYATEGALACLKYGFEILELEEIVSFTAVQNMRSRAVMERIGMHHDIKDDFNHPKLFEGHSLRRHVLYRLKAENARNKTNQNIEFQE